MKFEKYNKKDILVLGYGATGKSIIKFFKKQNANVFLYDDNININDNYSKKIKLYNPNKKKLLDFFAIFVSPGISKSHELVKNAIEKKIFIASDIELFWENKVINKTKLPIVGITGTNGKSTIAIMISNALKTVPLGNFGNTVLDNLEKENNYFVIELSSFQLDYIHKFKPNIGIISNIKTDHLNYHKTFNKYLKTKTSISKNQKKEDYLIINNDDDNINNFFKKKKNIKPQIIKISNKSQSNADIYYKNNIIYDNFFTKKKYSLRQSNFHKLKHNQLNSTIVFTALLALGLKANKILNNLNKFKGLPHRLEFLGSIKKIEFYNDSKATNVAATCSAINSFKKVILIAGGSDKGESFKDLNNYSNIIIGIYLVGDNALKIKNFLNKKIVNNICENLKEALEKSYKKSLESGKYYPILFSPASASFDNFKNYEIRGNYFKKLFNQIKKKVA
ncbi:MAG: UDP-N-acetylmuramoyl-L-alanine--D-glutamate ligase [Pelagibacterales bacterium]|nr:UDP-N-acetylmuramoyl-L-alanine--D-glutamate ligase [Pelagibacterales bacterium]OUU62045.1 MAG: UDP-N-acetylmuramoyl-L-alanine--D-glutamate ligase [Alphaproteobacteria bacterium TMED62]|tara:strand:- start:2071 stop:3420 length:1350 start_codon:yes stop_codon:yes gene_type:complete